MWSLASARMQRRLASVAAGAALLAVPPATSARSITGVCPDGSMFVVQREAAIPCSDAKRVEPHDLPPLKAQYLPRPYGWEQHQRRQDRNNPYNLVDQAPTLERGATPRARREAALERSPAPQRQAAPAPPEPAPAPPWAEQELRDLALLVELTQRSRPALFGAEEANPVSLGLARSEAFEPRLRALFEPRGGLGPGRVLLFHARPEDPARPGRFHAQLTFVQDGHTFSPAVDDPRQLGVLDGALGEAREPVLGYVVVPERFELAAPLDIYWNDRLLTATLL